MRDFLLASREPGKLLHAFANFLPRHTQLIELLEVQPKLRADAKPVAKTPKGKIPKAKPGPIIQAGLGRFLRPRDSFSRPKR